MAKGTVIKAKDKMLRLNPTEAEAIRQKNIEVNKKLIAMNKEPLKESELTHKLIELALKNMYVNKNGEIEI